MIDARTVYFILGLIAVYATTFFLAPNRLAQLWERDGLPVHWIMKHFRYWSKQRLWICGVGLGAAVISVSFFEASIMALIAAFVGMMLLASADAFQIRRLSVGLPNWSPSTQIDQGGDRTTPTLDLLFGKKSTNDEGHK